MSTNNITNVQNNKDLDKFIRLLVLKSVQVIVQSRSGDKIKTACNTQVSCNDWFNVAIEDRPEVNIQTKQALGTYTVETTLYSTPLCVEITLETVEGDRMLLEVWSLRITEKSDPTMKASYSVYNRIGILLKSLLSVTRATPAYKLSRKQCHDSYKIYHSIYAGEPNLLKLGEGQSKLRVGQLCTTIGTLNMAVNYRTKMTISPTQTGRDTTLMLKSDHFLIDTNKKNSRFNTFKKNEDKIIDLDKPLRPGAFVDTTNLKNYSEEDHILPEIPPFNWLLNKDKEDTDDHITMVPVTNEEEKEKINSQNIINNKLNNINNLHSNNHDNNNNNIHNDSNNNNNNHVPKAFSTLNDSMTATITNENQIFNTNKTNGINGTCNNHNYTDNNIITNGSLRTGLSRSKTFQSEDERFKELHFPFATENSPISDLAKFYRDCFNAPPLQQFDESPEPEAVTVDSLTKQLEQFETSLPNYDNLLLSLCQTSVDTN